MIIKESSVTTLTGPLIAECSTWLSIVGKLFTTRMGILLAPHGLTPSQFSILHHVTRQRLPGGQSISQIAVAVEVEQPAVTKTTAKFQNLGLVRIEPHPTDKRSKLVHATAEADRLLGMIYQDMGPDLFKVFESLNGSDIEVFASQLKTLGRWLDQNRL
ncbi:MarR family transcriptional regulator [Loktanella sp. IMCC34160]|nr:MarR family transcriptional regulator [Loktanella sp. IMCC34160]